MAKITINEFAKKAYKVYLDAGMTPAGACALMGNQYAESAGFLSNRVEFLLIKRLKEDGKTYTDESYTAAVDSGKISRKGFLNPRGLKYGYGLSQWTSPDRKAGLYDLAKSRNVSIADEQLALDYTLQELKRSYPSTLKVLKSAKTVKEASDYVLVHYESPADCGDAVKAVRADYGRQYYDYFSNDSCKVTAKHIVDIMEGWVGLKRSNCSHKPIIDLYNSHKPWARGYKVSYTDDYCDTTVSAAFIKAGAVELIGGTECGVEEHIQLFKKAGIWNEDGTIVPEIGYIAVYNWDDNTQPNDGYADHIGIVSEVYKKNGKWYFSAIEGNMNGNVGHRTDIPVACGYIRGFACPKYYAAGSTPDTKPDAGKLNEDPKHVLTCTASSLYVRTWAGKKYPTLKSVPFLKYGNLVDYCDEVNAEDGTPWYFIRIKYGNGYVRGFASSKYLKRV